MIDGDFTGAQGNGWSVFDFVTGIADAADALLTLASPLPAGQYNLTFTIYQNYCNPGHILGDFALDYTTAASPTLSSPQIPVSIQNATSLNGTTFSLLSPGELLANTSHNSIGTDTYTISALVDSASPITGIFLDAIKNPALPGGGPGGQYPNGNFVVSEFTLDATAALTAALMSVTVTAGQTYNVSSGQTDTGDTVDFGGTLNVLSGGTMSNTYDGGGPLNVSSGGTAVGTVIAGPAGAMYVNAGATVIDTTINGGSQQVNSGARAINTAIFGGSQHVSSGAVAVDTTMEELNAAVVQKVDAGGTASGTILNERRFAGRRGRCLRRDNKRWRRADH